MIKSQYNYYGSIDTINMEFKKDYKYAKTIEIDYGINLDFDDEDNPVNLEIDSASKYLNINKKLLLKPKIKIEIIIGEDIQVKMEFIFKNYSKKTFRLKTSPDSQIASSHNTFIL